MRKGMTCLFLVLLTSSLLVASDKRTPAGGIGKEAGVPDPSNPFRWVGRLGDARFAHDGQITSVLLSPNGKEILSTSRDKTIRLWDLKTGTELWRFATDTTFADNGSIVLSPDGKIAWIGVGSQAVKLDYATGKELKRVLFPRPRKLVERKYQGPPDGREKYHGLICGMELVDDGRSVLVSQSDRGLSLINADSGKILWSIKKGFQLYPSIHALRGAGINRLDRLPDINTKERKRKNMPSAGICGPNGKVMYRWKGNRIYGFEANTNKRLFPSTYVRSTESDVGINAIYLLSNEKRVLLRAGHPRYGWGLWDRESRTFISNELLKGAWRKSGDDRIMDVDERTGKVVGIASQIPKAKYPRVFTVQIDQPVEERIVMGSTGGKTPNWIRFTQNPDQFASAWSYPKTIWWLWDVNTPEKRIDLPGPSYFVPYTRPVPISCDPTPITENGGGQQICVSPNRTQFAMSVSASPFITPVPQRTQIIFWSFPEMVKKGTLDIGRLSGGKNNASWATDHVFSRWTDSRIWVWRDDGKIPNNLWWTGAKKNRHQNEGAVVTPTRLELRDKPVYAPKAMGKDALAKWVVQLASDVYKAREKASTVLESIHDDDIPVLAKFNPRDPEAKTRLLAIRKTFKIRKVDYRLLAAIDLPITVELLAEHPDGRHVLIYGEGKFATGKVGEEPKWGRGFVWLRFDAKKSSSKSPAGVLKIVSKFQLPLLARSMRFARDGELLIGTAAGTVELFSSIQPR